MENISDSCQSFQEWTSQQIQPEGQTALYSETWALTLTLQSSVRLKVKGHDCKIRKKLNKFGFFGKVLRSTWECDFHLNKPQDLCDKILKQKWLHWMLFLLFRGLVWTTLKPDNDQIISVCYRNLGTERECIFLFLWPYMLTLRVHFVDAELLIYKHF